MFLQFSNKLTIANSIFNGNQAYYGGAIYIHHNYPSNTVLYDNFKQNKNIISDSTFSNNVATMWGGAVFLEAVNQMHFAVNKFTSN